ncbi:MAG: hypothetical protein ACK5LS_08475, partial [Propioniciclava sp.]
MALSSGSPSPLRAGLRRTTSRGVVTVDVVAAGVVRVRFLDHEHQHPPLSYAIPSELPSLAATVSPAEGSLST